MPRGPARPAGRGGGARPDRLEVRARAGADRPRLRRLGPVRVPRPPGRGRRRGAPAREAARALPGARRTWGKSPGELPDWKRVGPAKAAEMLGPAITQEADAGLHARGFAPRTAEVRKALRLKDGDYLDVELTDKLDFGR